MTELQKEGKKKLIKGCILSVLYMAIQPILSVVGTFSLGAMMQNPWGTLIVMLLLLYLPQVAVTRMVTSGIFMMKNITYSQRKIKFVCLWIVIFLLFSFFTDGLYWCAAWLC